MKTGMTAARTMAASAAPPARRAGGTGAPRADGGPAVPGAAGPRLARMAKRFERTGTNGDGAPARAGVGAIAGDRFRRPRAEAGGAAEHDELQDHLRPGG